MRHFPHQVVVSSPNSSQQAMTRNNNTNSNNNSFPSSFSHQQHHHHQYQQTMAGGSSSSPSAYLQHGSHPHTLLRTRTTEISPPTKGCSLCRAVLHSDRGEYFICVHHNNNANDRCGFCLCPKCSAVFERALPTPFVLDRYATKRNLNNNNNSDSVADSSFSPQQSPSSSSSASKFPLQHRLFIRNCFSMSAPLRTRPKTEAYVLQPQLEPLVIYEAVSEGAYPPQNAALELAPTIIQAQRISPPFHPESHPTLPFLRLNYGGWIQADTVTSITEIRDPRCMTAFNNNNINHADENNNNNNTNHNSSSPTFQCANLLADLARYHHSSSAGANRYIPSAETIQQAAEIATRLLDWECENNAENELVIDDNDNNSQSNNTNNTLPHHQQSAQEDKNVADFTSLRPVPPSSREDIYTLWVGALLASHVIHPAAALLATTRKDNNRNIVNNSQDSAPTGGSSPSSSSGGFTGPHQSAAPTPFIEAVSICVRRLVSFCAAVTSFGLIPSATRPRLIGQSTLPQLATSCLAFSSVWVNACLGRRDLATKDILRLSPSSRSCLSQIHLYRAANQLPLMISLSTKMLYELFYQKHQSISTESASCPATTSSIIVEELNHAIAPQQSFSNFALVFTPPDLHVDPTRKVICQSLILTLYWSMLVMGQCGGMSKTKTIASGTTANNSSPRIEEDRILRGCERALFWERYFSSSTSTNNHQRMMSDKIFIISDLSPAVEFLESGCVPIDTHPALPAELCSSACNLFQGTLLEMNEDNNDNDHRTTQQQNLVNNKNKKNIIELKKSQKLFREMDILEFILRLLTIRPNYAGFSTSYSNLPFLKAAECIEYFVKDNTSIIDICYEAVVLRLFHALDRTSHPPTAKSLIRSLAECGRVTLKRRNQASNDNNNENENIQQLLQDDENFKSMGPSFVDIRAKQKGLQCRIRQRTAVDLIQAVAGGGDNQSGASLLSSSGAQSPLNSTTGNTNNGGGNFMTATFPSMPRSMTTSTTRDEFNTNDNNNNNCDTIVTITLASAQQDQGPEQDQSLIDLFVCSDCASAISALGLEKLSRMIMNNNNTNQMMSVVNFEILEEHTNLLSVVSCPLCEKWSSPRQQQQQRGLSSSSASALSTPSSNNVPAALMMMQTISNSKKNNNIKSKPVYQDAAASITPQRQENNSSSSSSSTSTLLVNTTSGTNTNNNDTNPHKKYASVLLPTSLDLRQQDEMNHSPSILSDITTTTETNCNNSNEEKFRSFSRSAQNFTSVTAFQQSKYLRPWWMAPRVDAERVLAQIGTKFGSPLSSLLWRVAFVFGDEDESILEIPGRYKKELIRTSRQQQKKNNTCNNREEDDDDAHLQEEEQNNEFSFFERLSETTLQRMLNTGNLFWNTSSSPATATSSQNNNNQYYNNTNNSQYQESPESILLATDSFNNRYQPANWNSDEMKESRIAVSHLALTKSKKWIDKRFDIYSQKNNNNNNNMDEGEQQQQVLLYDHIQRLKQMFEVVIALGEGIERFSSGNRRNAVMNSNSANGNGNNNNNNNNNATSNDHDNVTPTSSLQLLQEDSSEEFSNVDDINNLSAVEKANYDVPSSCDSSFHQQSQHHQNQSSLATINPGDMSSVSNTSRGGNNNSSIGQQQQQQQQQPRNDSMSSSVMASMIANDHHSNNNNNYSF